MALLRRFIGGVSIALLGSIGFGAPVEVQLVQVEGEVGLLSKPIPKGEVGILLCPYLKREIICGYGESLGGGKVRFYPYDPLQNSAMAVPVVPPKPGYRVVFQKDYNRVVVLAPDQNSYSRVVEFYRDRGATVLPSDLLITVGKIERDQFPTREQLIKVAKELNIGRYLLVTPTGVEEVDALSLTPIGERKGPVTGAHYRYPFFTTYNDWEQFSGNLLNRYRQLFQFGPLSKE